MQRDAGIAQELRQQFDRHQHALAGARQRAFRDRIDMHERVFDVGAVGQRAVARHRPRRRGPDHHAGSFEDARRQHREPHPDRRRGVVGVFDFRFRQRGFFHHAPQHRAQAAIQRAVQHEFADFDGDRGLRGEIHRRIPVRPVAVDAEAAEFARLHRHEMRGMGAAFGAEIDQRDVVLVAPGFAVLLLDLPFDRQAVAIPAGDVMRVVARHLAASVDHILEDLVQRMADMDVAVRVRRAVMQNEFFPPLPCFAQPVPQPQCAPSAPG